MGASDASDASDASSEGERDDDLAGRDLYAALGLRREDAPDARAVKRAYHRAALRFEIQPKAGKRAGLLDIDLNVK